MLEGPNHIENRSRARRDLFFSHFDLSVYIIWIDIFRGIAISLTISRFLIQFRTGSGGLYTLNLCFWAWVMAHGGSDNCHGRNCPCLPMDVRVGRAWVV